jgi:phosphate transport system permease protein
MTARAASPTTTDLVERALRGKRIDPFGTFVSIALLLSLLVSLGILVTLLADMLAKGWSVLADRGIDFITSPLSPDPTVAGLSQGIFGSVALTGFVVLVAFPLGVGAAIYLEEYASDTKVTRFIVANIRNLAGVPSIVYGLLGLSIFVKLLSGVTNGRTLVSGGLTLAVLVLPIMVITASEALRAVPQELRQAAFGVGATRWEMIRHQLLPVAAPAILTGSVLTLARAFGESAPLLLAGAILSNFFAPPAGTGLIAQVTDADYTALPIVIFNWARQPQQEFVAITAAGIVVLLVLLLTVNAAAIILRDRFERK